MEAKLKSALEALESIRETAMNHPCFDRVDFDARDIDDLCKAGGDICDWTMLAITADDAIKELEKP